MKISTKTHINFDNNCFRRRNVSIRGYDVSVLEYVTTEVVNADEDNWRLQITIYYSQMFNNTEGSTYISLEVQERTIKVVVSDPPKKNDYGEIVSSINLTIPKVNLNLHLKSYYLEKMILGRRKIVVA